ncbi:hypothetical protein J6590_007428 [Homalodisca vitripennis]|nr:hypothetical protein J6590_007428 [Homalodisca vitripennis]
MQQDEIGRDAQVLEFDQTTTWKDKDRSISKVAKQRETTDLPGNMTFIFRSAIWLSDRLAHVNLLPLQLLNSDKCSVLQVNGSSLNCQSRVNYINHFVTLDIKPLVIDSTVTIKKSSLKLNLGSNGLEVTSKPPPITETGSLSGHSFEQQPRSTLLDPVILR